MGSLISIVKGPFIWLILTVTYMTFPTSESVKQGDALHDAFPSITSGGAPHRPTGADPKDLLRVQCSDLEFKV